MSGDEYSSHPFGGNDADVGGRGGDVAAVGDVAGVVVWKLGTNGTAFGFRLDTSSPARSVDCIMSLRDRYAFKVGIYGKRPIFV